MKKKILLIGGAGFIGMNILKYLGENRDYQLTIADNFFRGKMDEDLKMLVDTHHVKVVEGDFTDAKMFDHLEKDYDQVYMLASVVGVEYTSKMPHELIRINTLLILNTLEWLKGAKCGKILFTSTSECYAGTVETFDYAIPTPETVPLCINDIAHPRFTYAVTKMLGESGFFNYSKVFGFEATVIRYHNVFGPRMGFKHVIPHLAQRFLSGETPFKVYGADQTRSFNYIDDAVNGTVLAMEKGRSGEVYHIGAMDEITIRELVEYTGELMDFKGVYVDAETFPGSVKRRCPDITKAIEELGYQPQTSWQDGLKSTIDWYKSYLESGKLVFE